MTGRSSSRVRRRVTDVSLNAEPSTQKEFDVDRRPTEPPLQAKKEVDHDGHHNSTAAVVKPVFRTRLLSYDSVHEVFQIPLIKHKYRANLTISESFASVLSLHNQSFNIYTHLLGWVFFLYYTVAEWQALQERGAPLFETVVTIFYLCCAQAQMLTSSLYHILQNVSPEMATLWLKIDVVGIIGMIFGSNAIGFYHGFRCEPQTALLFMIGLGCCLGFSAGVSMMNFKNIKLQDSLRNASFVLSVGFGVWPSLVWWYGSSQVLPEDIRDLIVKAFLGMAGGYAGGFVFYILRIPERWAPGKFDLFGASHQIWHTLVFLAGASWCVGMLSFGAWAHDNLTCGAHGLELTGEALAAMVAQPQTQPQGPANLTSSGLP